MPEPRPTLAKTIALTFALALGAAAIGYVGYAQPGGRPKPPSKAFNQGQGRKTAIVLRGNSSGTIRPGVVDGAYRAIGMANDARVSNLTIDGLEARVIRDCVRVNGSNIVIRNVRCSMLPPPQTSMHELPEGLHIKSGNEILVEESRFNGFQMVLDADSYWNGDGVSVERGVNGITFRNVSSNDNTDAGFDIKPPVKMDDVSAAGNCRNYRFWSDADLGTVEVGDVVSRGGSSGCVGIWVEGSRGQAGPRIRIRTLILEAKKPLTVIKVDKGAADIRIDRCIFKGTRQARLVSMQGDLGNLAIDPSCRLR